VHRGPDGVFDAVAALPVEHARVDQFVERGAQMAQGRALLRGPAVRSAVGVLLRYRERGGEQPRFLAGELQVRRADRAQPTAGRGGIAVLAADAGDAVFTKRTWCMTISGLGPCRILSVRLRCAWAVTACP